MGAIVLFRFRRRDYFLDSTGGCLILDFVASTVRNDYEDILEKIETQHHCHSVDC